VVHGTSSRVALGCGRERIKPIEALGSSTRAKGDGRESVPCKRRARGRPATPCWQGSKALFLQVRRAGGGVESGLGEKQWRAALPDSAAKEPWPLISAARTGWRRVFSFSLAQALAAAVFFSACVEWTEEDESDR
jgi:hypothetical protein